MKNTRGADIPAFFQHSASKYKNAGSCVQRDDSSFRQRLHYSGGFARNVGGEESEGNSIKEEEEERGKGWLLDGVRVLEVPQWTVMGQVEGSLAILKT